MKIENEVTAQSVVMEPIMSGVLRGILLMTLLFGVAVGVDKLAVVNQATNHTDWSVPLNWLLHGGFIVIQVLTIMMIWRVINRTRENVVKELERSGFIANNKTAFLRRNGIDSYM